MIEQVLFTMRPGKNWDEQPVAQTSGIGEDQGQELAAALRGFSGCVETASEAFAISFFPLSWGTHCVARTVPAAGGGFTPGTILTHCLVVDPEMLGRFANNPFAMLHAVLVQGWLRPLDRGRPQLRRFAIEGGCEPLDSSLVTSLAANPGLAWFEALIETALAERAVALPLGLQRPRLFAALVNCLPVECRPWFSFTTGPALPEQSTFRLFCLAKAAWERCQPPGERCFAVLDPDIDAVPKASHHSGWSGLVSNAIGSGCVDWLADQFRIARPGLRPEMLDALGSELLPLLATRQRSEHAPPVAAGGELPASSARKTAPLRRPDNAHEASPSGLSMAAMAVELPAAPAPLEADPSQAIGREHPATMQKLEQLDDVVFEAIAGKAAALDQLRELWPAVIAELGRDLLEESQSQYLRHALSVWKHCINGDELRNPRMAVAVTDVISILLGVA